MDLRLAGKLAVVTGAGRGFGRGTALCLAEEGCDIVAAEINVENADRVVREVGTKGRRALVVKCDISDREEVRQMIQKTMEEFGKIDILVNNAGIQTTYKPLEERPEEDLERDLAVNLKGAIYCCQAVIGHMKNRKYGKIINLASATAFDGGQWYPDRPGRPNVYYATTKAGLVGFTKALAKEGGPYGINVNAIAPGYGDTGFWLTPLKPEEKARLETYLPLGSIHGFIQPDDVAYSVAFLASDCSRQITGHTIFVDGGRVMF